MYEGQPSIPELEELDPQPELPFELVDKSQETVDQVIKLADFSLEQTQRAA